VCHQERTPGLSTCGERSLYLAAVLLVIAGEAPEVPVGDACQTSGLGDRQLVRGITEHTDAIGVGSALSCPQAALQFARTNPPRTVGLDEWNEEGTFGLLQMVGRAADGRSRGRSGISCWIGGRWRRRSGHRIRYRPRHRVDVGDECSNVEHPLDLGVGETQRCGGVGHPEQCFAIGSEASVGPDAERGSAPS
jgi:hypothetical protein